MINVLIADDHAIVRKGLKQILSETPGMTVAGEAADAEEVLHQARTADWDVLVLDLSMPGRSGFDMLKELQHYRPDLPVLVLSMHAEEQFAVRCLQAGASGYLTKESAPAELVKAIRKVVGGGKYVSASLAETLAFRVDEADFRRENIEVIEEVGPSMLVDDMLLVSGEVARTTPFEKGFPIHYAKRGDAWEPDPLIMDDQCAIINVRGKGLVVVTGCGHAGIINAIRHVQALTGVQAIYAVIGGFHLTGGMQVSLCHARPVHGSEAPPNSLECVPRH